MFNTSLLKHSKNETCFWNRLVRGSYSSTNLPEYPCLVTYLPATWKSITCYLLIAWLRFTPHPPVSPAVCSALLDLHRGSLLLPPLPFTALRIDTWSPTPSYTRLLCSRLFLCLCFILSSRNIHMCVCVFTCMSAWVTIWWWNLKTRLRFCISIHSVFECLCHKWLKD